MSTSNQRRRFRHKVNLSRNSYIPQKDISLFKLLFRILNFGPEMVGFKVMTRFEAYEILWQKIFDNHKKDGLRYKTPGYVTNQRKFNHIPKPLTQKNIKKAQ